jgi:hypothetical protein
MLTCPPFLLDFSEDRLFKGKSIGVVVNEKKKRRATRIRGNSILGGALASGSRDVKSRPAQARWTSMAQFDEKDLWSLNFDLCLFRLQVNAQPTQLRGTLLFVTVKHIISSWLVSNTRSIVCNMSTGSQ